MQRVNKSFRPQYQALSTRGAAVLALLAGTTAAAGAQAADADVWRNPVEQLMQHSGGTLPAGMRVTFDVGALDSRLKLAPCARIVAHLPAGARPWGRVQVGLRCTEGARWSVYVPVTVHVWARAWTANQPLAAGTLVSATQLEQAEVDLAAEPSAAIVQAEAAVGRTLARPVQPGQTLREADLKPRQWFAAGDTVRIVGNGPGFAISGEGQALNAGIEGQSIKVRTEGGRIVVGRPTAARQVEVAL